MLRKGTPVSPEAPSFSTLPKGFVPDTLVVLVSTKINALRTSVRDAVQLTKEEKLNFVLVPFKSSEEGCSKVPNE